MGGAQRGENKRRQQDAASRAVAKARGGRTDSRKIVAAVIGVVVLAAVVIGGVLWTNASKNETQGHAIQPQTNSQVKPEYAGTREGVVVKSGNPQAKTIDVYADFLCPMCGKFQQVYGKQLEEKINSGALQVRYHMVPMLAQGSNPPGYSLDSANAALAAADAGKFTQFHDSLFAQQPPEGGRGYDKTQLIQLGQDLGITDEKFADAVNNGAYEEQLTTEFTKTSKAPWFQGTPTVLQDGKPVQWQQADWLNKVTAGP